MTKLDKLYLFVSELQLQAALRQKEVGQQGNPHLATKFGGQNEAYIRVMDEIRKLKEKTK